MYTFLFAWSNSWVWLGTLSCLSKLSIPPRDVGYNISAWPNTYKWLSIRKDLVAMRQLVLTRQLHDVGLLGMHKSAIYVVTICTLTLHFLCTLRLDSSSQQYSALYNVTLTIRTSWIPENTLPRMHRRRDQWSLWVWLYVEWWATGRLPCPKLLTIFWILLAVIIQYRYRL